MLFDSREFPANHVIKTDVCIIGSGPAGLTMARELAKTSSSVALLESGGMVADPDTEALNLHRTFDDKNLFLPVPMNRQAGGNSNLWGIKIRRIHKGNWALGVRYMPLDDMDFEHRDWVPHSGWPIDQADLLPYYKKTEALTQSGAFDYGSDAWSQGDKAPISSQDSNFTAKRFGFGPRLVFHQDLVQELIDSQTVNIYLYATAVELQHAPGGSTIQRVKVSNLTGKTYWVEAEVFVLAMGGVQTTRLLLASNQQGQTAGVGNEQDLVGRFLMDHPLVEIGNLQPFSAKAYAAMGFYDLREVHGYPAMGHLALSREAMQQHHLLNNSVMLFPQPSPRQVRAIEAMGVLIKQGYWKKPWAQPWSTLVRYVLEAGAGLDYVALSAYLAKAYDQVAVPHLGGGGWTECPQAYGRFKHFRMMMMGEQAPDPTNRIVLSQDRDPLGLPGVEVHWTWGDRNIASTRHTLDLLSAAIQKSGLGRLKLPYRQGELYLGGHGASHPMGTTRMSWGPRQGVVNSDCRVHSVPNLYIASSSVFPTGGYANPTFTIVALSLRLADHLKGLLAAKPVQLARSPLS